jgi:hypothetical protein
MWDAQIAALNVSDQVRIQNTKRNPSCTMRGWNAMLVSWVG